VSGRPRAADAAERHGDLILYGDEAWTVEEWEAREHRRAQWRAYAVRNRRQRTAHERRSRFARLHPEFVNAVGALHDLGCRGGHYAKRGACKPIPVYSGAQEAA
jgi:hypothetical protein